MLLRFPVVAALATAVLLGAVRAQSAVYRSVKNAYRDPAIATLDDGFLGIPGSITDLVRSGGGQWVELSNGTARLTCRVFSLSNLYGAFLVDMTFTGRIAPGDPGYPPPGGPDLQLLPSAYVPAGTVDPATFVYYTSASGTLTGVRNFSGGLLTLASTGPVQLGVGANNRNDHLGLSGMFHVTVVSHSSTTFTPTGPATLCLDFVAPYGEQTTHPQPDAAITTLPEGRALVLPGVADDYVFVPAADFTEYHDGTAVLEGTLARLDDLDDAWHVALTLGGRVDPGQAGWPPAGSPVLQLLPNAYVANGGPIDPGHWHYYTTAAGTLTGVRANDGGEISLAAIGATQVGGGTNQTNTYFGCYGRYTASLVAQPLGHAIALTGDAELFALTAVFPVLPFPSLVVPPTPPTLPTLTDQGLILAGDNLAWVALVGIDFDISGLGDESHFLNGWIRVLDNQHVEVHPRPGQLPGFRNLVVFNPAIQSNQIQIQLTEPTAPALYSEPWVGVWGAIHVRMHSGLVVGPALSLIVLSQTHAPSVLPGIASLAIGNNFTDLVLDPTVYVNDPATGIAAADYAPITPSLLGSSYWFQGLVLDLGAGTLPLPATNAWRVDLQ